MLWQLQSQLPHHYHCHHTPLIVRVIWVGRRLTEVNRLILSDDYHRQQQQHWQNELSSELARPTNRTLLPFPTVVVKVCWVPSTTQSSIVWHINHRRAQILIDGRGRAEYEKRRREKTKTRKREGCSRRQSDGETALAAEESKPKLKRSE